MGLNKVSEAAIATFNAVNPDVAQPHIANILSDLAFEAGANVAQYVANWKAIQGKDAPEQFAALELALAI